MHWDWTTDSEDKSVRTVSSVANAAKISFLATKNSGLVDILKDVCVQRLCVDINNNDK